jgi:hypothetical protein
MKAHRFPRWRGAIAAAVCSFLAAAAHAAPKVLWLDHAALAPDSSTLSTFYDPSTNAGALAVVSSVTGNSGFARIAVAGVPPGYKVVGARIAYQSSNAGTTIAQTRLTQRNDPPNTATVRRDNPTLLASTTATYADIPLTRSNPKAGPLELAFRFEFNSTGDRFYIMALGVLIEK